MQGLPSIRGTYEENVPLAPFTTIKVGGPAEVMATFEDWEDLKTFLQKNTENLPITWVGKGSNLMVKDGGIRGLVAVLGKGFDAVKVTENTMYAEAGASSGTVARAAREAGLDGLAFLGGIPGSIGGALRMNAGAYGSETFTYIQSVVLIDEKGQEHTVPPVFVHPSYRHTELPTGWLYKAATWVLPNGDKAEIREKMKTINHARSNTQPLHMPSSGSWYKNPILQTDGPLGKAGEKVNAWKVVDAAGCRGLSVGGAQVSEQHCNFFVNTGTAKATDFMELDTLVQKTVQEKLGIQLEREVRWTGEDAS